MKVSPYLERKLRSQAEAQVDLREMRNIALEFAASAGRHNPRCTRAVNWRIVAAKHSAQLQDIRENCA